jgi:tripartite-type tricarboxylate transporter receptor subunit TctC
MRFFKVIGVLSICFSALHANAQSAPSRDYPNHPIKMVIPYAAGGPMDFIGRTLIPRLSQSLGQPIVIDNRAGAGGAIGTDFVAKSAADGYTLLNTSSSHASLPVVSASLSYDPLKDLRPSPWWPTAWALWWPHVLISPLKT